MKREVAFTALTLEGDPSELGAGRVTIKLFLESDNAADAAELFLNVELAKRRLSKARWLTRVDAARVAHVARCGCATRARRPSRIERLDRHCAVSRVSIANGESTRSWHARC